MIHGNDINQLWAANWPKTHGGDALPEAVYSAFESHGLMVDTCLRQLCVAVAAPGQPLPLAADELKAGITPEGLKIFSGQEAYRFVLEIVTGLRSQVPGETNIAGQFNKAWINAQRFADSDTLASLAPWMRRLANDASDIRREHLEGIGGASYGTLVRKLIAPDKKERVLFVGAGSLARSMLPLFTPFEVGMWNHRRVSARSYRPVRRVFAPEQTLAAAAWADHVIVTTPPDADNDARWRSSVARAGIRSLVHLGHRRGELEQWNGTQSVFDLDDVFDLRRQQADIRNSRLERARSACAEAALAAATDIGEPPALTKARA